LDEDNRREIHGGPLLLASVIAYVCPMCRYRVMQHLNENQTIGQSLMAEMCADAVKDWINRTAMPRIVMMEERVHLVSAQPTAAASKEQVNSSGTSEG
jgi:hypothetical protein